MSSQINSSLSFIREKYEQARMKVLEKSTTPQRPEGFSIITRNGLIEWTKAIAEQDQPKIKVSIVNNNQSLYFINEFENLIANIILERMEV